MAYPPHAAEILWYPLRLPAFDPALAGPALGHAGDPGAVRRLHRAGPRRAADLDPVHGFGDAAAVPARRRVDRQAAARADRADPLRRRLPGGGSARRIAGDSKGAI